MIKIRSQLAVWSSALGAVVTTVSCTVMIAATIVGLLGVIGIRLSAQFADAINQVLSPVAQPLLIGSLMLIVIGLIPRGRLPVMIAVIGGVLVYLAMFTLADGTNGLTGASGMSGMAAMSATQADPLSLVVFWLGMVGLAAAFVVAYRR